MPLALENVKHPPHCHIGGRIGEFGLDLPDGCFAFCKDQIHDLSLSATKVW
jgi:hypothetical protein